MLTMERVTLEYRTLAGKRIPVVDSVDLQIPAGQIHALVGPNGTGKTSLVRAAAGTLVPRSGTVRVFGEEPCRAGARVRRRMGILFDGTRHMHPRWTGGEALYYQCALFGLEQRTAMGRAEETLDRLGLGDAINEPMFRYSRGMRQKLAIALTLMHDPDLLILDEPTLGLDAQSLQQVGQLILQLKQQGKAILLTSHELQLLEQVSDQITVMKGGKILYRAEPVQVVQWAMAGFEVTLTLDSVPVHVSAHLPAGVRLHEGKLTCPVDTAALSQTLALLSRHGVAITYITSNCSLEYALKKVGEADAHPDALAQNA